jgi:hypothetical protein
MVIETVPEEKLLVMDIKEGWEPLCKFLGKPIPSEPFPHVNESDAVKVFGQRLLLKFALVWLAILSIVGMFGVMAFRFWRS